MNHLPRNFENQLRELEASSTPDISQVDQHWQAMKQQLTAAGPGFQPVRTFSRKIIVFPGIVLSALLFTSYFLFNSKSKKSHEPVAHNAQQLFVADTLIPQKKNQPDTTRPFLRARTTEGKEVLLYYTPARGTIQDKSGTHQQLNTLNRLLSYSAKPQQYYLNTSRDTIFRGAQGTSIGIRAGTFNTKTPVTIELKEVYAYADMILNGLTTMSGNKQLVSGGMVSITAMNDGSMLTLTNGKTITLGMPGGGEAGMELFYGEQAGLSDTLPTPGLLNWRRANREFRSRDTIGTRQFPARKGRVRTSARPRLVADTVNSILYFQADTISNPASTIEMLESNVQPRIGVEITELGWINCDRFYNDARPKIEFRVEAPPDATACHTVLAFPGIKSILPGLLKGDFICFRGVPEGEKASLITIRAKENSFEAKIEAVTLTTIVQKLPALIPTTAEKFKVELEKSLLQVAGN